ncbi:response regulator transcription factor [Ferruginibacter sp. HRS2-29]|uniref:response regulator transcription factor n=1 Tax=Ferruginibacter sp. HRS2-29 TaxID=2487334 RepID=UPI0020CBA9C4|nr:response regulator transcription factor [Ferruginibacter sp. HRS2-29]MCP9749587.1 DNA-binding response regulator [Ferruginibacter sp. HRS2-29]
MKLLLIEDEPSVAGIINKGLTENGHHITIAPDGDTGLDLVLKNRFDVIILDIMLPGMNGMQLCKTIRDNNIYTPILFLTALGTTENIVAGLNAGGDDYLVKPFKFAELEARIHSLARRKQLAVEQEDVLNVGPLNVNLTTKLIYNGETLINLTPTEFRLLEYFVRNRNKVLSRIEILEHVWGIDFNMGTNVVDVYINYLRKKIDTDPETKMIQTIIGMGYMLKV